MKLHNSVCALGISLILAGCGDQGATGGPKTGDPSGGPDAAALGGGESRNISSGGSSGRAASGSGGSGPRSAPDAHAPMAPGRGIEAGASDADGGSSPPAGPHSDRVEQLPEGAHCTGPIQQFPTLVPSCPIALCGNEKVDSCMGPQQCSDHGACTPTTVAEECDTTASQTCAGLDFVQGQVTCSSTCHVDWSGCGVCGTDPRIQACTRVDGLHYDQTGQTLALASNGEQAALVWPSRGSLRFALINDDLTLAPTDCFTDAGVNWSPYLAPVPNGWMLAYPVAHGDGTQSIKLTLLDASGAVSATPAPTMSGAPTALVARPNGGPLLLFNGPSNAPGDDPTKTYAMAALLDASGQPLWTQRLTEAANAEDVAATYTGDGFLWASRPNGTSPLIARFELDGTTTTTTLALGTVDYFTQLAWTGSEARLFWDQYYIALDRTGHALGTAQKLLNDDYANLPLPVQLGTRTAILISAGKSDNLLGSFGGGVAGSGHRSLVVLDQNGVAQPPFVVFANGNQGPDFPRQLVVVKDRLLAAFLSFDQRFRWDFALYLASIRP